MDNTVRLRWITPNAEQEIIDIARVSSDKPDGEPGDRLLSYLIRNQHWSPFEMVSMCVEINTTRDIGRQLLRHRSFSFQEFSQRYAETQASLKFLREMRLQDLTNRQKSVIMDKPTEQSAKWLELQNGIVGHVNDVYQWAISQGVAKEVARCILPEGLTPTKMYMSGTMRSWIHFYQLRSGNGTQLETQDIATRIGSIIETECPTVYRATQEI